MAERPRAPRVAPGSSKLNPIAGRARPRADRLSAPGSDQTSSVRVESNPRPSAGPAPLLCRRLSRRPGGCCPAKRSPGAEVRAWPHLASQAAELAWKGHRRGPARAPGPRPLSERRAGSPLVMLSPRMRQSTVGRSAIWKRTSTRSVS
jgi:hypothetical protein